MGTAVLQGLILNSTHDSSGKWKLGASVRSADSLERLKNDLASGDGKVDLDLRQGEQTDLASKATMIIIGCKSEDLESLLSTEGLISKLDGKTIVSLMAGLSPAKIQTMLKRESAEGRFNVVQVIPSIGAKLGDSMSLVTGAAAVGAEHSNYVDQVFESLGAVKHVSEALMDDAVAVGAAAHATAIVVLDAMTDAAVAKGMPRATAASVVAQCLRSASRLMDSGMSPESLKAAMSTPSGITLNSLVELESKGTRNAVAGATMFAVDYARQMSAGNDG